MQTRHTFIMRIRDSDKGAEQSYETVTSEQRRREHEVSTEGSKREANRGNMKEA